MEKLAALIEKKRKARQESVAAAEAASKRKKQEAEAVTLATQTSVQEKVGDSWFGRFWCSPLDRQQSYGVCVRRMPTHLLPAIRTVPPR